MTKLYAMKYEDKYLVLDRPYHSPVTEVYLLDKLSVHSISMACYYDRLDVGAEISRGKETGHLYCVYNSDGGIDWDKVKIVRLSVNLKVREDGV